MKLPNSNIEFNTEKEFSLGNPTKRFKLSFSDFPTLNDNNIQDLQYLENYILKCDLPKYDVKLIDDEAYTFMNMLPNAKRDMLDTNQNYLEMTFMLDEQMNNYQMFRDYILMMIRKTKPDTSRVEHTQEYFIGNISIDFLSNIGFPYMTNSISFSNCILVSLGNISLEDREDINFQATFRFERFVVDTTKMEIYEQLIPKESCPVVKNGVIIDNL